MGFGQNASGQAGKATGVTPAARERQLAKWRAIQRDPNTPPPMALMALQQINKLMGLRPQ